MTVIDAKPTCLYHPIRVIFLDDSREFLDALDLEFGAQINMLTLTNSNMTMQLIDSHSQDIIQPIFNIANGVDEDTNIGQVISFNIGNIISLIYDKARFNKIAILVVDYQMPEINGIGLCKKIKESDVLKIMLTAEADKDTAINAFNDGLIDKFILKTNENLYQEISLAVQELTQRYFEALSKSVINRHSNLINELFEKSTYRKLFSEVATQAQAVEYYLVDTSGSILFLDQDAHPTWLIVRHVDALMEQFDLLKGYDLPERIMDSVAKKEVMLFMLSEKEYKKPIGQWIENLFGSKKLDDNYYYSIIQDKVTDSIDWSRVVSYSSYISEANDNG